MEACVEELKASVEELNLRLKRLKERLSQAEAEKHQAATYGLRLLESNNELQAQLEKEQRVMTNQVEALEQEKFSLQREVELKAKLLESLASESESCKAAHALQVDALRQQMEHSASRDLHDLHAKLELLKAEAEEARLSERQAQHKLGQQAALVAARGEEVRAFSQRHHETSSTEMLALHVENAELLEHKDALTREADALRYRTEQLELSRAALQRQSERLQQEKEEDQRVAVSYFNALEKAREANQELQMQLSHALQQAQDPRSKGNSLFGELEDRRVEMERQLISLKVQHKNLQKQHTFTKQQLNRLTLQIGTLLQMKCGQVDLETMQRSQATLDQRNHEILELLKKNRQLEEELSNVHLVGSRIPQGKSNCDLGDGQYYVDLLKLKLDETRKELSQLKEGASVQRMKQLAESQNVLDLERKVFALEGQLQSSQGETMRLQVKVDQLQLKYEPEELNKRRIIVRRREKLPVDETPAIAPDENPTAELLHGDPEAFRSARETPAPTESERRSPPTGPPSCSSAERRARPVAHDDAQTASGSPRATPEKGHVPREEHQPVKKTKVEDVTRSPLADRNAGPCSAPSSPLRSGCGGPGEPSTLEDCWNPKRKPPGETNPNVANRVIHISSKPFVENKCAQQ